MSGDSEEVEGEAFEHTPTGDGDKPDREEIDLQQQENGDYDSKDGEFIDWPGDGEGIEGEVLEHMPTGGDEYDREDINVQPQEHEDYGNQDGESTHSLEDNMLSTEDAEYESTERMLDDDDGKNDEDNED